VRVAVLDYEAGNVRSAAAGFTAAGADAFVTSEVAAARTADALVVPGVGHIRSCLDNLRASGLHDLLGEWIADSRPVFGICVGMQLLYEHSAEGDTPALGLLPGRVENVSRRRRRPAHGLGRRHARRMATPTIRCWPGSRGSAATSSTPTTPCPRTART
jgi:imidazole glycerol-phosphate synthase subunit HisH